MKSWQCLGVALVLVIASFACGDPPTSPTTSPFVANFNGFHSEAMILTGVSSGECVGDALRTGIGSLDVGTVAISQSESDVTAIVRSATTGLECTYEGAASIAGFAASSRSCDTAKILFACSNGNARILELVRSTITASITDSNTTTGTVATSYNVFEPAIGDDEPRPVAGLVTQQQFTAQKR